MTAPTKLATLDNWIQGCLAAAKRLSLGRDGYHVRDGESWAQAIARVAARLLLREGYGRPRGPVPDDWAETVNHIAAKGTRATDGLVAGPSGLRVSVATVNARCARRLGQN